MLEVINARPTDLSGVRVDSAMLLNCWEKSSTPLIRELERTVNFAERKCGDLMQQLNFYKEYYKKWIHAERLNGTVCPKKKNVKKCCKSNFDIGSSSENEFERVNQYFYKKIRSKITEMNNEITQANRKINNKFNNYDALQQSNDKTRDPVGLATCENSQVETVENKICRSEPTVNLRLEEKPPSSGVSYRASGEDVIKLLTEKQSSKSVPDEERPKMSDTCPVRKRFTSLQRYKLRSKSLPHGVRRKFGFGGFIEIIDSKMNLRNKSRSKSRTSLKVDSHRSFKTFKSDGHAKSKLTETNSRYLSKVKKKKSSPASARSSKKQQQQQKRVLKSQTAGGVREANKIILSKGVKSESVVPWNFGRTCSDRSGGLSQTNDFPKSESGNSFPDVMMPSPNGKSSVVRANFNSAAGNLNRLMSRPNSLIPFLKQPIPFIPCSSTSKTFNLGLNVQQVLSMIKHRRHSITLQAVIKNGMQATRSITEKIEPTVNTLFFSHVTTRHSQVTSTYCPARTCIEDTISIVTDNIGCRSNCSLLKQTQAMRSESSDDGKLENCASELKLQEINKLERPEDVWVVEQPDANSRESKKPRSRCTCFPSKHCVDYQKVLRQYTGWRPPTSKTASFTSENYSSCQPMITYPKTKLCSIPSKENLNWTLQENDGKIELMKVHDHLINLNRRYSSLEEQIMQKHLDDYSANAELDAMESELSVRELEFKDIITFYQQLLMLKEKIKSLRVKGVTSSSQTAIQAHRPKKDPLRPTPSMALTKVLRKIQGLQDNIKQIDAP